MNDFEKFDWCATVFIHAEVGQKGLDFSKNNELFGI